MQYPVRMTRLFSPGANFSKTAREVPFSIIAGEHKITHGGSFPQSPANHSSTLSGIVTLRKSKGFRSLMALRMELFIMLIDSLNKIMLFFANVFKYTIEPRRFIALCVSQYSSNSKSNSCVRPSANTGISTFPRLFSVDATEAALKLPPRPTDQIFFALSSRVVIGAAVRTLADHDVRMKRGNCCRGEMTIFLPTEIAGVPMSEGKGGETGSGCCRFPRRTSPHLGRDLPGNM